MPEQLTFDLPVRAALGRDDFFVSTANEAAAEAIRDWANWASGKLVLCGPKSSGKTHLAHVWAAQAHAHVVQASDLKLETVGSLATRSKHIAVENIENIAGDMAKEQTLFHLHNLVLAGDGRLLLTSRITPSGWPLVLPDLKSRVMGTGLIRLNSPDDALLSVVLVKLFADRQVDVSPDVVRYLAGHMERSFTTAGQVVAAIDKHALSEGRAISRNLAARVLDKFPSLSA